MNIGEVEVEENDYKDRNKDEPYFVLFCIMMFLSI